MLGYGSIDDRQKSSVSVTMRTPTHDFELALGFVYSEGIITPYNQIMSVIIWDGKFVHDNN